MQKNPQKFHNSTLGGTVVACRELNFTLNLSTLISLQDDAVLFSSMWHIAVVSGVRASAQISAAVAALGPAWSQPGQVAPVTSHRAALSRNTQHTASRWISSLSEGPSRPHHLHMAAGSVNVNRMTEKPSCSVSAPSLPKGAPATQIQHVFLSLRDKSSGGVM